MDECLESLLNFGDSSDELDSCVGNIADTSNSNSVSAPQESSCAGSVPPETPQSHRGQSEKRGRKRRQKKASRLLSSTEKKKVFSKISEAVKNDSESCIDAVVNLAQSEKHLSFFPARGECLVKDGSAWCSLVEVLLGRYVELYQECTTKADKYLSFQVKWSSAVAEFVADQPAPSSLSVRLSDADRHAVGFALSAAAWQWCGKFIEETVSSFHKTPSAVSVPSYSSVHVHRFFGAALCRYIATLDNKIGRALRRQSDPKSQDTAMLALLKNLRVNQEDKVTGSVPNQLLERDHGGMTFLKPEFQQFAESAVERIVSTVNADCYQRYGKDMLKVASMALACDKTVLTPFVSAVDENLSHLKLAEEVIMSVGKELLNKVLHAICEEVVDSCEQDQVLASGNVTTKGQNLRDSIHVSKS